MIEGTVKFFNTTKGFGFLMELLVYHVPDLETGRDGKVSATNLRAL